MMAQGGRECIEQKQESYIIFATWSCCCCWSSPNPLLVLGSLQYEVSAKEMNCKFPLLGLCLCGMLTEEWVGWLRDRTIFSLGGFMSLRSEGLYTHICVGAGVIINISQHVTWGGGGAGLIYKLILTLTLSWGLFQLFIIYSNRGIVKCHASPEAFRELICIYLYIQCCPSFPRNSNRNVVALEIAVDESAEWIRYYYSESICRWN